ncbi:MAG: MBOAT family protein [Bacteroidia bacterium]|nr:MBOAT family protein [Bacteroidia bacterium]
MLFNSLDFAIFLPIVFFLYWFAAGRNLRVQNAIVICASFVFYGWWDWRFLSLIVFSTAVDYTAGRALGWTENARSRRILLLTSVIINLGLLSVFKYYNFFIESFASAFSVFGLAFSASSLNVILPVGISFYTFQTMSYTIDVYRRNIEPTKDWIALTAYVSFFPQLVAGPIERARSLLPQFLRERRFDGASASEGLRQILWGLIKKMVIADNCAAYADMIFGSPETYSGSTLLLGSLFFAFQIYGDFSGYTDIATGTAKLFGITLSKNFAYPYFSRSIPEFWRRWHISLSTWFRDYVYIPLGGGRDGAWNRIRNMLVVFVLSGLWHGANWTYVLWGIFNALLFIPSRLRQPEKHQLSIVAAGRVLPSFPDAVKLLGTFFLTLIAWVIFRSETVSSAMIYFHGMFSSSLFTVPHFVGMGKAAVVLSLTLGFLVVEWFGRENDFAIQHAFIHRSRALRWGLYILLVTVVFLFSGQEQEFIYFQF